MARIGTTAIRPPSSTAAQTCSCTEAVDPFQAKGAIHTATAMAASHSTVKPRIKALSVVRTIRACCSLKRSSPRVLLGKMRLRAEGVRANACSLMDCDIRTFALQGHLVVHQRATIHRRLNRIARFAVQDCHESFAGAAGSA